MPKEAFSTYRDLTILVNGTFAFLAGIMSVVLLEKGLDVAQVGIYFAIYSFGVLVFEIPTGAFADAFGRKKAILAGFICHVIFLLGFLLAPQGAIFMGFALVVSMADAMISGSREAHVVDMLVKRRKRSYTQRLLASGFGWGTFTMLLGSIVGGYVASYSVDYAVVLCILFAVLGLLYSQFRLKEEPSKANFGKIEKEILSKMKSAFRRSWSNRTIRATYLFSLFFGLGVVGLFSYWQIVLMDVAGWGMDMLGLFFALISMMIIIGSKLSTRFKANLTSLSVAVFAMAVLLFLLYGITEGMILAGVLLLLEVVWGSIMPMLNAVVNNNTDSGIRATVISIRAMSGRFGWVLFGIAVFFIGADEPRFYWLAGAIFLAIGALILLLGRRR